MPVDCIAYAAFFSLVVVFTAVFLTGVFFAADFAPRLGLAGLPALASSKLIACSKVIVSGVNSGGMVALTLPCFT